MLSALSKNQPILLFADIKDQLEWKASEELILELCNETHCETQTINNETNLDVKIKNACRL